VIKKKLTTIEEKRLQMGIVRKGKVASQNQMDL
jgi:hypothetical protein